MSRKASKNYKRKMTAIRKVALANEFEIKDLISLMQSLTHSRKVARWRKRGCKEVEVPTDEEFMGRKTFKIMYEVRGKLVDTGMRRIEFEEEND